MRVSSKLDALVTLFLGKELQILIEWEGWYYGCESKEKIKESKPIYLVT